MVFSLRSIVSGLAILTVVHGHRLPARTTSTYNYNVPISAGFPKPTLTSGLLVDVHDPKEQYATLAPRKRPGNCNDLCALKLEGLGKSARLKFEGHCSSFLSTTIAHTVVTVTTTTTVAIFDNNWMHRPATVTTNTDGQTTTLPRSTDNVTPTARTVCETIQSGTDGTFTIFPTHIPRNLPITAPACANRHFKYQHPIFTSQFSSVCSCRDIMPATTTIETATRTMTEQVTTNAPFKIKIKYQNQTTVYLNPFIDEVKQKKAPDIKDIEFSTSSTGAQLFTFTPDGLLQSRGSGILGWIHPGYFNYKKQIEGKLVFLEESYVAKNDTAFFPQFHIDNRADKEVEIGSGLYYKLISDSEKLDDSGAWVVTILHHNASVPDERFLIFVPHDHMVVYKKEFDIIAERVDLLAEPATEGDGLGSVVGS